MYAILDPTTGLASILFDTEEQAEEALQFAQPGAEIIKFPSEDDLYDVMY